MLGKFVIKLFFLLLIIEGKPWASSFFTSSSSLAITPNVIKFWATLVSVTLPFSKAFFSLLLPSEISLFDIATCSSIFLFKSCNVFSRSKFFFFSYFFFYFLPFLQLFATQVVFSFSFLILSFHSLNCRVHLQRTSLFHCDITFSLSKNILVYVIFTGELALNMQST